MPPSKYLRLPSNSSLSSSKQPSNPSPLNPNPPDAKMSLKPEPLISTKKSIPMRIYLAGPEVFERDPIAAGNSLKALVAKHRAIGLFPMDNELSTEHLKASLGQAAHIRAKNMELIRSCDAIVANMIPFRGPSMDVGTAYEMGVGAALGKIVVGYTSDLSDYVAKTQVQTKCKREKDGVLRDKEGMSVEEFGHDDGEIPLLDNLMVACGTDRLCTNPEYAM